MSELGPVALALVTGWTLAVSVVAGLLVRQVAVVTRWAKQESESDGLEVGAPIPEGVLVLLPHLASGLRYLAVVDAQSQHGREFALEAGREEKIARIKDHASVTVAVLGLEERADELVRLLPAWFEVVTGDVAVATRRHFKVRQSPSIFEIERGQVTGRAASGYGVVNFVNLVHARAHSNAADFAGPADQT